MINFPGLIVSSSRTMERNASSELYYLLTEILDIKNTKIEPVKGIMGLSIASFDGDSVKVLSDIESKVEEDQSLLQYVLKLVPVQYRIPSSLKALKESSSFMSNHIKENMTWKVNLRRRHTQLSRQDIISAIVSEIKNGRVKLENPDKHIIVEVVGKWTYLAITTIPELSLSKFHLDKEKDEFYF
ncbi:MAG: THUMP domain-containing protein [Candidatus Heimdallarchaeaceae archaeon]